MAALDPQKVKLLCSFGGKILPRPSDGALRYAGGHTRILSLRRSSTIADLLAKIGSVFGGDIGAVKYQLPDEDLDALISISSQEDLENMMEEFDRVTEAAAGDGSARMRIFVFSPLDLADAAPGEAVAIDTGQCYINAVNGIGIKRKDSFLSAAGSSEGMSPSILSPSHSQVSLNQDLAKLGFLEDQTLVSGRAEPQQVHLLNPNVNVVSFAVAQPYVHPIYVNAANATSMVSIGGSFSPTQGRMEALGVVGEQMGGYGGNLRNNRRNVDSFAEENLYRADQNSSTSSNSWGFHHQPLCQLPPLHPTHFQHLSNAYVSPLHPIAPQACRFDDCQMCQKCLPHAHLDRLINEHQNGSIHEPRQMLQSYHSEDLIRLQASVRLENIVNNERVAHPNAAAWPHNKVEPKVETIAVCHFSRPHDNERVAHPNAAAWPDNKVEPKVETTVGFAAGFFPHPHENERVAHPTVVGWPENTVEHKVQTIAADHFARPHENERVPHPNVVARPENTMEPKAETTAAVASGHFSRPHKNERVAHPNVAVWPENIVETKVETTTGGGGHFSCPHENERVAHPNVGALNHIEALYPPGPMRVADPTKVQAPSGVVAGSVAECELKGETAPFGGQLRAPGLAQEISHLHEKESLVHATAEVFDPAKVLLPQTVSAILEDNVAESKVDNVAVPAQSGAYGFTHVPKIVQSRDHDRPLENLNGPTVVGLHGDTKASNGVAANPSQSRYPDPFQALPQNMVPPHNLVGQNVATRQFGPDVSSVKHGVFQAAELPSRVSVPDVSYDHLRPINGMMESLCVSTFEPSANTEHPRPVTTVNHGVPMLKPEDFTVISENNHGIRPPVGVSAVPHGNPYIVPGIFPEENSTRPVSQLPSSSGDLKHEHSLPSPDKSQPFRSQAGGNPVYLGNAFIGTGVVPVGNSIRPINQMPPSSLEFTHIQSLQPAERNRVPTVMANHGPLYSYGQEMKIQPEVLNEQLLVLPSFSCGIAPAYNYNNAINVVPVEDKKDKASWFHLMDVPNNIAAPVNGNTSIQYSNSNGTNGHSDQFRGTNPSDSLFCNQDPRKILGNMQMIPPMPNIASSQEFVAPSDLCTENHVVNSKGSHAAILVEDGGFQHQPNSTNNHLITEQVPLKQGEEHSKQEVQALAEQVKAIALQSSLPLAPAIIPQERKEFDLPPNRESGLGEANAFAQIAKPVGDHRIEGIMTKQVDKMNFGFPITDDMGHLQIIKNSDLEELRELGSGTFGTVYHGKWRGSDVAIKRISERCFAVKPSEEEKMKADFWNEACNLADLHHPNIVAFYGVVLDGPGGSFATVTEFMVNGSLRRALQKNDKTLDKRGRLLIAMDVAFGMEYLHSKNMIHFDLKSDNLLVNLRDPQRPICKVADLGLSKVKCQTLISGGVRGTLPWMAPELLNGGSSLVSNKVDVFSFGIVMWELLTGEEPYADLHYGTIIGGIVSNTLRPPMPENYDLKWKALMEQCWLAEPSERPNFTEIASRLRSMAASLPQKP